MNIRDWPMDQIMQLPDNLFGRRFGVFVALETESGVTEWDISELSLPNRCVIWELVYSPIKSPAYLETFRLAWGDQLPTTTAEMDLLEPAFHGLGLQGAEPRTITVDIDVLVHLDRLRMPVETAGRRLVLEAAPAADKSGKIQVGIVVSSVPTEVPDWLISR